MIILWLSVFGGFGAVARFVGDGMLRTVVGRNFPWATIIINSVGSFILGALIGLVQYHSGAGDLKLIIGTGFCGGFTTFSTAIFEAVRLIEEKRYRAAAWQIAGNAGLSLAAAYIGLLFGILFNLF